MAELINIFSRLEKIFGSIELNYVIVGGIAIIHYGYVRSTQDIDIIMEDKSELFPKFLNLLKENNFDLASDQFYQAYKEKTHVSVFDNESHIRLDIKIASREPEIDVLENAKLEKISNYKLRIAPLEYVLLGKLLFIGDIDDIPESELLEYQDILDFIMVYNSNKDQVNEEFIKKEAEKLGLQNTLDKLKAIKI
ncbi:MAG: hypothetical protein EU551_02695 [Promethearchaeota archaeon]|nr:MAG: hypothetical protein EU551_02695 [Candidatus Lokiarchaeota archaeon]